MGKGEREAGSFEDPALVFELFEKANALAAASVKQIFHAGAWVPVELDADRFTRLPSADQEAITKVALGQELGGLAYALASFRAEPASDAPGGDGEDVRAEAVEPPGDNRAARRARSRRGAAPRSRPG
jgi:hypothetical protein